MVILRRNPPLKIAIQTLTKLQYKCKVIMKLNNLFKVHPCQLGFYLRWPKEKILIISHQPISDRLAPRSIHEHGVQSVSTLYAIATYCCQGLTNRLNLKERPIDSRIQSN